MRWRATYSDSSVVNQYNEDETKNAYNDLQRDGLVLFELVDDGETVVAVELDANKKLFWRMRVKLTLGRQESQRVHLVGYREKKGQKVTQVINVVYPDGAVEQLSSWDEQSPWLYPIIFREQEQL